MKKLIILIILLSTNVFAQSPEWLTGYIGNFTKAPFGIFVANCRLKYFFDIKINLKSCKSGNSYYDNISVNKAENIFGDKKIGKVNSYSVIDAGFIGKIVKGFYIYGGIGWSMKNEYYQYCDMFEILGEHGRYWIDGENSESGLNLTAGMVTICDKKYYIMIGADTRPKGINLGIGFIF